MKRILIAALALCMIFLLAACGEKIVCNAAADLPEGTEVLFLKEAGESRGAYYIKAEAGGNIYTFRLAEGFTAQAFEPGADGALYRMDYNSPRDFYTQYYRLAVDRDALGMAFSFAFEGDALASLMDTAEPSPPDGPEAYTELPEGVVYKEAHEWQGDPGEGLSAPEAAVKLFNAVVQYYDYTPGDLITITMTGFEFINDAECYLYTVETPDGVSEHAVDYFSCVVYVSLDGEYRPIGGDGRGDLIALDEEQAMYIVSEMLGMQLSEGKALVAKGEGEVNSQPAFLFDLGTDTKEKFTAEEHYAVTGDGAVWLLDVLADEWQPAAAG